jgi:gentisate 1,2-dioxygenase
MDEYIQAYEYEKNVNPPLKSVPITEKHINDCSYGITFVDFSEIYNVEHKSTSPNLLASFIRVEKGKDIKFQDDSYVNGSSHLFYIINGKCEVTVDDEKYLLSTGDIMISPLFSTLTIENIANDELQIYYINDSPLLNYLGSKPVQKKFKTAVYSNEFLLNNLESLSDPNNNRKGILLSNKDTEKIGVNTITPVLWALYNELPPHTVQKPHKHNSVALDFCISCGDPENIYTLIGNELDECGNIIDPVRVNWEQGKMFVTPPGLWHSHNNNTGDMYAYILPIQDAGLLLYQRILGIVLL